MKKNLEEFAKENRSLFDTRKIDDRVWVRLKKELGPAKQSRSLLSSIYFKWIAAAAIVIIAGIVIFNLSKPGKTADLSNTENIIKEYPGLELKIRSFTTLIESKKQGLNAIEAEQPDVYKQFTYHLTVLQQQYQLLEKELQTNPNKTILLDEMMANLELQVKVVNEQLELIRQYKNSIKEKNEKKLKNI
jgi:hypothetical protein